VPSRGALVVLFTLVLVLVGACSSRQAPPPGATGDQIYALQNCAKCHGVDRYGNEKGPPLVNLERQWTRDTLADFLRDPKAVVEVDERLAAIKDQYPLGMGRYNKLSESQRLVLADWLLESRASHLH
jgi:mono/diheme cytochrome c family protein